jgi:hypothetical protein
MNGLLSLPCRVIEPNTVLGMATAPKWGIWSCKNGVFLGFGCVMPKPEIKLPLTTPYSYYKDRAIIKNRKNFVLTI